MSSFASFLEQRGVVNPHLTNSGRADSRFKNMKKLEEEWFNLTFKGEPQFNEVPIKEEACPVCYEKLGAARVTTACGHNFCVSCFTQNARETDNCPMCRASLSETKPNKKEPMGLQVSQVLLGDVIRSACPTTIIGLYETIYHDIVEMEGEITAIQTQKPTSTRTSASALKKKCEELRETKSKEILQMISETHMIMGFNVLHRANLWHTEDSAYPFDPIQLFDSIPLRHTTESLCVRESAL